MRDSSVLPVEIRAGVRCRKPLHNGPRSAEELAFLKSVTQVERAATKARVQIKKAAQENSQSEGDNLDESDSDSRSEEDEYESDGIDDMTRKTMTTTLKVTIKNRRRATERTARPAVPHRRHHPLLSRRSPERRKSHRPPSGQRLHDRLDKLEKALHNLVHVVQVIAGGARAETNTRKSTPSASHGTGNFPSHSNLTAGTGMEGCPQIPREDLMKMEKFEKFEIKYKEYLDKATDRKRTYHKMTHGFRKYHNEVRAAIRSLFDKSWQLQEAYVDGRAPIRDPAWNDRYLEANPEGCDLLRGQIMTSFTEYIQAMRSPTAYGDEVMLVMAAEILQARIVVLENRESVKEDGSRVSGLHVNFNIVPDSGGLPHPRPTSVTLFLVKTGQHFDWAHLDDDLCQHRDCRSLSRRTKSRNVVTTAG